MVLKKVFGKAWKNLSVIGKPMTMHVEAIYVDEYWDAVKKLVESRPKYIHTFFVMTPANYDYFRYSFNVRMSREEISKKMKERYLWLIEKGQRVELHVHADFLMRLSYKEQEALISESAKWFEKNLGYKPKRFVPGCWTHNPDTLKILKKYKMELVKFSNYRFIHDYELIPPSYSVS